MSRENSVWEKWKMPSLLMFVLGLLAATHLPALGFDVAAVVVVAGYLVDTVEKSDEDDIPSQVIFGVRVLGAINVKELYGDFDGGVLK